MTAIIFARPRHEYGSYQDAWQLIALSGYPLVYYDEIDVDVDAVYILMIRNGEMEAGFPQSRARLILWDMEYRREPTPPIPGVSEVWHMDAAQARLIGAKYVPVGGHAGLRQSIQVYPEPLYDVAYLAYMTYRRQVIHAELLARGLRLPPTSAWGAERDAILNASRVYLHVHQHDDIPAVPGLRLVVAAAYGLPVVTEECADYGVFEYALDYTRLWNAKFDQLTDAVKLLSSDWNDSESKQRGAQLHHFLCVENTFRAVVERSL